jgi:transposase
MIPADIEIYVALDPVSLHKSFDSLAGEVQELVGRSPRAGGLFIFFNRRRTALKALFFDGTGLCIFYKRADRGRFQLPDPVEDGRVVELSDDQLEVLLDGIELPPPRARAKKNSTPLVH